MLATVQTAVLASDAGLPDADGATPPAEADGVSSGSEDDDEDPAAAHAFGQRARAAAAAAQALPEEPQATGKFKQSGFYIPHARRMLFLAAAWPLLTLHCSMNDM